MNLCARERFLSVPSLSVSRGAAEQGVPFPLTMIVNALTLLPSP